MSNAQAGETRSAPELIRLSGLKPKPVRWLWQHRIPLGKLSIISGDPGVGKGLLTMDMIARVSTGTPFPDCLEDDVAVGSTLLISGEDDAADTLLPRLLAAGGDSERVVVFNDIVEVNSANEETGRSPFDLDQLDQLVADFHWLDGLRLIVIDPITAYLSNGTDSHKNSEVRRALLPLQQLAQRTGVAVVLVSHLNKGTSENSIHRVMGSLAFTAAARTSYLVVKSRNNPLVRQFLPSKGNVGPEGHGIAYEVDPVTIEADGVPIETCRIQWDPTPLRLTADEALQQHRGQRDKDSPVVAWVRDALSDGGKVLAAQLFEDAEAAGFSKSQVRRALNGIGASGGPIEYQGPWAWGLPGAVSETEKSANSEKSGPSGQED